MSHSRKLTLGLALVLVALSLAGFLSDDVNVALRLNSGRAAVNLAAAVWALIACMAGTRASNVFLVALGILFCVDSFVGLTQGLFYLSFETLNGAVAPQPVSERLAAALPHLILGPIALVAGLVLANRGANTDIRS